MDRSLRVYTFLRFTPCVTSVESTRLFFVSWVLTGVKIARIFSTELTVHTKSGNIADKRLLDGDVTQASLTHKVSSSQPERQTWTQTLEGYDTSPKPAVYDVSVCPEGHIDINTSWSIVHFHSGEKTTSADYECILSVTVPETQIINVTFLR